MLAAPARYVSVSELYSTDEVELLLDEIRDLEPASCRAEDVQDFEIAGSGCGGGGGGGRSPAGTDLTERSWDSHAHYLQEPPRAPQPLAPLYCRPRYLLSPQGLCTLLLAVCSAGACGCVWGAVGARLGGGGGAGGALRALQLGAVSSALLHAALLLMRLTALHLLMPIDWDALGAAGGAWSACWLGGGGGALLAALARSPPPQPTRDLFIIALSLSCVACVAGVCVAAAWAAARWRAGRARAEYRAVPAHCVPAPAPAPAPAASAPL